jgi:EmrB/QacA subfamily drug resistance transporter
VSPAKRPLAIGIWGGISGLGVAVGPLVGGAIMEGWNWQAIFWINIPVALVAIPLALFALNNDFGAKARIDVVGALLAGVAVLALVHGIVRGNDDGWTSPGVVAELAAGAVLATVFLFWQRRAAAPLVPLSLFRDRSFSVTNVVGFAFSFGTFGSIFILIQFMQVVQGASPLEAAVQTMPWTLAPMIVAPLAGIFAPRIGTRALLVTGLLLQGGGLLWLALEVSVDVAYGSLIAPFIMAGVGMGLVFAPSATALLATLGLVDHAKASGVNSTVREIGIALGTAVMTAIFVGAGGELRPDLYVDAARPAIFTGAAVLFIAMIVALWLPAGRSVAAPADRLAGADGVAGADHAAGADGAAGAYPDASAEASPDAPALVGTR